MAMPKATMETSRAEYPMRFAVWTRDAMRARRTTTGSDSTPATLRRMRAVSSSGDRVARLEFGPGITHVMAVVNLSPESRVRHSVVDSPEAALARAREDRGLGASIIDLGAQSSHFENRPLTPDEEIDRLVPALTLLVDDGFVVSCDTWKPEVAAVAVDAGAAIVNDTGGLRDPRMVALVRESGAGAVAMHIEGENPLAVGDRALDTGRPEVVADLLRARVADLRAEGITGPLLLDPGLSINYRSDY